MRRQTASSTSPCNPCGLDSQTRRPKVVLLEGSVKQALETGRNRLVLASLVFALAFFVIGVRLVEITALGEGREPRLAEEPTAPALVTGRADIVDRNGVVLATTLPTASLYANPRQVRDPARAVERLSEVLPGLDRAELVKRLSEDRAFAWVRRDLTPRQQAAINRLGIPGFYFQRESKRVYPHGGLVSHLVGFTDIDNRGIAGLERSFDSVLRGGTAPLPMSLDIRIQHILADELQASIEEFSAIGGSGIVLDVENGEILSMVSLPTFDPTAPGRASDDELFNRSTLGIYEMGSVFKIFNTAMALDSGAVALHDKFDVSKPIRVARFTINDFHPENRTLNVPEVFIHSSNIGSVQMAMEAGTARQQAFMKALGLLEPAPLELPEMGSPLVPDPWREINTMTISYGHGLAVSPLHMANAVASMVNGGVLKPATLLKRVPGETVPGIKVLREDTSDAMRWLMRLVVMYGTGRNADSPGYLVGGKTGTADKLAGRRYARNARIASFVGAFPMDDPRYVVFVMVDEPKGIKRTYGYATGGWVAAPVVKNVVRRMAPLLGVEPRPIEDAEERDVQLIPASARGFTFETD